MDNKTESSSIRNIFIVTILFVVTCQLPIILYRYTAFSVPLTNLALEIILMYVGTITLFSLIMLNRYTSMIFMPLFFTISGIHSYYVIFFRQVITTSVVADISSVNLNFVMEYVNFISASIAFASFLLGCFLSKLYIKKNKAKILIFIIITCITLKLTEKQIKPMWNYTPFNIIKSVLHYFKGYKKYLKTSKQKINITDKYNFKHTSTNKEPLLVVLIIGESMRGDHLKLNGYKRNTTPYLSKQKNLTSFKASSSGIQTRLSLPFMLTRATPPNFDQAIAETGLISIFNHLGFVTSWIGNQGAFGGYDLTYTSNILLADHWLIASDVLKNSTNSYDMNLLPYIRLRLKETSKNHFMVVHLLGSHWNTNLRYPENFKKFQPICESNTPTPAGCPREEIVNSYDNSILYTDFVLHKIIEQIKNKNAILIYSSDHGTLLGENGRFGHGQTDLNANLDIQKNIGFFTYVTDKFIKNHPHYLENIKQKKNYKVSHDYIFHSLLDCVNIQSEIIDKKLSLCNKIQ